MTGKTTNKFSAEVRERTVEAARRWRDALEAWLDRMGTVRPRGLEDALAGLRRRERDGLDLALGFLEAAPSFFRSGYIKEGPLRALKRVARRRGRPSGCAGWWRRCGRRWPR